MKLATLFRYLIGQENAIQKIASSRYSLLIGFLFCLSAALARHYDGKYLLREPWFLLAPAAASILTSAVLFVFIYLATAIRARSVLPGFAGSYLTFLGLYWMTGPLAWLYGIPYERFLSEADAAQMNVWTLELVSLWRVLLISRVVSVLTPCSFFAGFTKVGVPAFSLLYVALFYARMPLVNWMGGVNVPPSVAPVASAYMSITLFGPFVILIGGIGWLVSLFVEDAAATLEGFRIQRTGEIRRALPILGSAVILAFTAVVPFTQREQQLRYEVKTDLKNNQVEKALTMLATHDRKQFPPQWTPPPWPEYGEGERNPSLMDIIKALKTRSDAPEWVQSIYQEKAKLYLSNERAAGTASDMARDSTLKKYAEAGAVPCLDARWNLPPGQRWAFWIVFRSASCADFVIETSIGPGVCGGNPTTEMRTWKGGVDSAQSTRPAQHDRVCYRTRSVDSNQWSQWQVLTRHVSPKDSVETYEVMLP